MPKSNAKNVENVIQIVAKEAMTEDTKVKTDKVGALKEMTVDKTTTATAEIGTVQSVRIIISHSEQNVIDVEKLVALVADVVLDKTTEEVETKDTKAETDKVDALKEMTVDKTTTAMLETGIVQNAETTILLSGQNVIHVDFLEAEAMTDVEAMIVVEKLKSTPITIGIALNVTTPTLHSDRNVIVAKHLAQVAVAAVAVANVETMVGDLLVEITAEDLHSEMTEGHLDVMMAEDLLVAMTVDDLHNEMTEEHLDAMMAEDLLDAMTVNGPHSELMVQCHLDTKVDDRLAEMGETEEVTVAAIKAAVHTVKVEPLNAIQENLATLENHVAMDLGMHITAHQSPSLTRTEMIDGR